MLDRPAVLSNAPDLAVAGAGPMGLVAALTAARAGLTVKVFEKAGDFSAGAGWRAGGMLAPECEAEVSDSDVVALGRRAIEIWPTLVPGVLLSGSLVLAPPRDPHALRPFAAKTENHQALDAAAIARLEPALAGRFHAGLYYPGEGHLNPRETYAALRDALETAGVPITFNWTGEPSELAAGQVLDARGLGAGLADLRGVKGEMALIRSREISLTRPVRLIHHRHPLYIVPRADGVFMIGATTIESDEATSVTLRSAGELLTQAYNLHPAFAEAEVIEFNAGLRPAFPDNNPRIAVNGRIISINGLYRHGWLLAPALAEQMMMHLQGTRVEQCA